MDWIYRVTGRTPYDIKEIVEIRNELKHLRESIEIDTPKRHQERASLAEKINAKGVRNRHRHGIAYFYIGPPASGKSFFADPKANQLQAFVADSDVVKPFLQGYSGGRHAAIVHRESDDIMFRCTYKAMMAHENLVFPMVGNSAGKVMEIAESLKELGYEHLHLRFVDVDPRVCAQRVVKRFVDHGRFVDPYYVLYRVGTRPKKAYDILQSSDIWSTVKKLP